MVQLDMNILRGKGASIQEQLKAKFPKEIRVKRSGHTGKTSYKLVAFYSLEDEARRRCSHIKDTHFCLVRRRRKPGYVSAVYGVYKSVISK